jgi:hypothetical protein
MNNLNIEKMFDKYLDITTVDEKEYHIEKKKVYINDSSEFYGDKYVVTSHMLNGNNLYVLSEIYSFEDKRLRYLYDKYTNVKLVETIEKDEGGSERHITVIENYSGKQTLIGSIGNISRINSDIIDQEQEKNKQKKENILKLILKPKYEENKIESVNNSLAA